MQQLVEQEAEQVLWAGEVAFHEGGAVAEDALLGDGCAGVVGVLKDLCDESCGEALLPQTKSLTI